MDAKTIVIFLLVGIASGGFAWALLPYITGDIKAEKRHKLISSSPARHMAGVARDPNSRRSQVAETMKEIEDRQKRRHNLSLKNRIEQAGLSLSRDRFYVYSAGLGLLVGLVVFNISGNILFSLMGVFAGALGIPRWVLSHLRKRRQAKFLNEFPNAIDVIVRGVKAGLPLADSMRIVATESQEPVRSEFREIMEIQTMGVPIGEACEKLYERIGVSEANFFSIVIAIQQKTGGSLADTLGNLSKVLRDRKKMKAKISAVSMEAKASAGIIGSLPLVVMGLVYLTSPNYIELLWTHELGRLMLACSAFWMFCGIMIMRKMINFEF